jgi:hypothetical protein
MINNVIKEHGVNLVKGRIELRAENSEGKTHKYFGVHVGKNGELFLEANEDVFLCDSLKDLDDWIERTYDTVLSWEALEKLNGILWEVFNWRGLE